MKVANLVDGIKMAVDFISMSNIKRTHRLVSELRKQRLASSWGDDVLQLYTALWYAWVSLSSQYKSFPMGGQADVDTPHEDSSILRDPSDMAPTPISNELPSMSVDNIIPAPTTLGNQSSAKATTPNTASPVSATHNDASDGLVKSERQRQRQIERNKRRRGLRHQASLLRKQSPEHDQVNPCPGPNCKRILNRFGLLDHW
jgi:hypothetical protein